VGTAVAIGDAAAGASPTGVLTAVGLGFDNGSGVPEQAATTSAVSASKSGQNIYVRME
jgi:hypothetical protein